ncbi:MAG: hypothetical protein WB239_17990 [Acidimicrobiia bacterium]
MTLHVGDLVRILQPQWNPGIWSLTGVVNRYPDPDSIAAPARWGVYLDRPNGTTASPQVWVDPSEIEVISPDELTRPLFSDAANFAIGDTVRIIRYANGDAHPVGATGTVTDNSDYVIVEIDNTSWPCHPGEVELVNQPPPGRTSHTTWSPS